MCVLMFSSAFLLTPAHPRTLSLHLSDSVYTDLILLPSAKLNKRCAPRLTLLDRSQQSAKYSLDHSTIKDRYHQTH